MIAQKQNRPKPFSQCVAVQTRSGIFMIDRNRNIALKALPVWTFVGDADSERVVKNMRSMVAALREAGVPAKHTEYRGVGHNSWDRAYHDPALIDWMLGQPK